MLFLLLVQGKPFNTDQFIFPGVCNYKLRSLQSTYMVERKKKQIEQCRLKSNL